MLSCRQNLTLWAILVSLIVMSCDDRDQKAPKVIDAADDEAGMRRIINQRLREEVGNAGFGDSLQPPWLVIPGRDMTHLVWRMGSGEDYNHAFYKYYSSLSEHEQALYSKKYPEPDGWSGYYALIVDRRGRGG